jgi:alpha-beta hydrolase superfamily lysophospholipase
VSATDFQLKVQGDTVAFVRAWVPPTPPRAAIQIVHGLAEHSGRYARFATALNREGFAVYAADLPGHGRTARAPDELGHFADDHGWRLCLQSIRAVHADMRERHPQVPLALLGHSMGSFLAQDYVIHHGRDLSACIMSAPTGNPGITRTIALALVRTEAAWGGPRVTSRVAEQLSFTNFNRRFKPARTPFDWLSRDPDEVDRYIGDPRCGFKQSAQLWIDLLTAAGRLREKARLARIPKALPMLLIGGDDDPVTDGEKGPRALEEAYRLAGLADVSVRIYPGARHELLNETCREEVTTDILRWLDERIVARVPA